MQRKFKNKNISLPDTDFLKGKVMTLYGEAKEETWIVAVVG